MLNDWLSRVLKEYKQVTGLTTRELGRILGVHNSTISRWINGANIDERSIPKLLDFIELELIECARLTKSDYNNECIMRVSELEESYIELDKKFLELKMRKDEIADKIDDLERENKVLSGLVEQYKDMCKNKPVEEKKKWWQFWN